MALSEKITIQPFTEASLLQPHQITLTESLYRGWKLDPQKEVTLKCGRSEQTVYCFPKSSDNERRLECHPTMLTSLHLPSEPLPLHVRYDLEKNQLELGPIVSVLTVVKSNEAEHPVGGLSSFCQELARYSTKRHTFFYVFSLKDWRKEAVTGLIWRHQQWDRLDLPHPNVIHNRIHSRTLEQIHPTRTFFQSLRHQQIPYFNERFLDKWEVHEILDAHKELAPYLPETTLYEGKDSFETLLNSYPTIFVKPIHGSQGKQIFRITEVNNYYELDYTTFNGDIQRQFATIDELFPALKSRLSGRPFIVQQGLSFIRYKCRPLDFRILCSKKQNGEWHIVSTIARVSNEEQFVSNIAQGGELFPINDVLTGSFPTTDAHHIKKLLFELAIEVVTVIGVEVDGDYGELGVDLALDPQGQPWIIEVNTKPSKNLDPERKASTIRPSAKSIIDYAGFLAGFW